MPVSVTVTQLAQGVADNKRFVDVNVACTSTLDATQASSGVTIPMTSLPIDEVTDVHQLQPATATGGGVSVILAGTKDAPTLKFVAAPAASSTGAALANTNTPPANLRLRLFGA